MSVQPVRLFGDPVLRTRAEEVVDFDAELRRLVVDLHDTMVEQGGAGIAAPQIGVGLRVFTWMVDGESGHVVNPTWEIVGDEQQEGPEGCLSIPGLRFDCRRAREVVARGWDQHGEPLVLPGVGQLARAVQHEVDTWTVCSSWTGWTRTHARRRCAPSGRRTGSARRPRW